MIEVIWLEDAIEDLKAIGEYIAQDNQEAAYRVVVNIKVSGDALSLNPELGRIGRIKETRELVISGLPYILPYTIQDEKVIILHVMHTSRKWPNSF